MHARKKALLRKFLRPKGQSTAFYINTVWLNSKNRAQNALKMAALRGKIQILGEGARSPSQTPPPLRRGTSPKPHPLGASIRLCSSDFLLGKALTVRHRSQSPVQGLDKREGGLGSLAPRHRRLYECERPGLCEMCDRALTTLTSFPFAVR